MSRDSDTSDMQIKEAISKSGYLEEQKVVAEFEKQGFFASANYAFEDQDKGESREVDFIATRYTDFKFAKTGFYFYAYGEVKKRTNPLVFFERKHHNREREPREVYIPIVGSQEFFLDIDLSLNIKGILKLSQLHHQAKHDLISTQFCEIAGGKARHKDLYETLFLPLLKCVDSEMWAIRSTFGYFNPDDPNYFLHVFQPIVVISGPLYSYDVCSDSVTRKEYILYRRHYVSKTINTTLLFDIVTRDHLVDYVSDKLVKTYDAIENSLREHMSQILEYCVKDRLILDQKVSEGLRQRGFKP